MARRLLPLVLGLFLAVSALPGALAGPGDDRPGEDRPEPPTGPGAPDDPGAPDRPGAPERPGAPAGPPSEFPGPGGFPYDASEHFPEEGCERAPARPQNVPSWVPVPFERCAEHDEESEDEA